MLYAIFHKRNAVGMILWKQRIIGAELFDEFAIAGCGGFRNDDPVVRALFSSAPREPDFQWHAFSFLLV
jgi:hypothetical protein